MPELCSRNRNRPRARKRCDAMRFARRAKTASYGEREGTRVREFGARVGVCLSLIHVGSTFSLIQADQNR